MSDAKFRKSDVQMPFQYACQDTAETTQCLMTSGIAFVCSAVEEMPSAGATHARPVRVQQLAHGSRCQTTPRSWSAASVEYSRLTA